MNRWYSSQVGRFTTPDRYQGSAHPSNPQTWNRYTYALNDPANMVDPSGREPNMVIEYAPYVQPGGLPRGGAGAGSDFISMEIVNEVGQGGGGGPSNPLELLQMFAEQIAYSTVDILDEDCAELLPAGSDPQRLLQDLVANNGIRVVPFDDGIPAGTGAQYNPGVSAIYIASNRYFFTGILADGTSALNTVDFRGLTMTQMQQTIILHEMIHYTRAAGADNAGQEITLPSGQTVTGSTGITLAIKEHCFGIK
jgi:hypothetical protein